MATNLFIGIDLGTSGCRAMAIDDNGQIQAEARTSLPPPKQEGACSEQAPELWWTAVATTLTTLFEQIPATNVKTLAVDGTSGTLLLADGQGQPLGPALMYNDGRSRDEAKRIHQVAPNNSAAHGATSALAKLLHLTPNPQARYALHQADWIVGKLTGHWGVSDTNNCMKLGYDPIQSEWPEWLDALGVDRQLLPQVFHPGEPIATLSNAISKQFDLPAETLVVAGTTDSTAAFLATGASQVGEAVTSLGSTLVMKVIADKPVFAPEFGVYSQPLGDLWLVGGGSNSGGAVLLNHFTKQQLDEMSPHLRPEQKTGLDYYPLIRPGERFPLNDPELAPRLQPRPDSDVKFFQGMLEGMARIEHEGFRRLESLGAPYPTSIRSAGGGAHNAAWTLIRQNMLAIPMIQPHHQEAAYGAAMLARLGFMNKNRIKD